MTATVEGIAAMIATAQQQYPGHRLDLVEGPDAHNARVRFSWALSNGDDPPVAVGIDFETLAEDGRLRDVTGLIVQR